jgi:hypothetical protein
MAASSISASRLFEAATDLSSSSVRDESCFARAAAAFIRGALFAVATFPFPPDCFCSHVANATSPRSASACFAKESQRTAHFSTVKILVLSSASSLAVLQNVLRYSQPFSSSKVASNEFVRSDLSASQNLTREAG